MMSQVAIGLGSNLGDRLGYLTEAVRRLSAFVGETRMSALYETEPVGHADQPPYLNAVVVGITNLEPFALLRELQQIETALGRVRSFVNAPRTIDLDLLLYDDVVRDTPQLTLPHPRLHERFFVLVPLAALVPTWRHPSLGQTIRELLTSLGAPTGIAPFHDGDGEDQRTAG